MFNWILHLSEIPIDDLVKVKPVQLSSADIEKDQKRTKK